MRPKIIYSQQIHDIQLQVYSDRPQLDNLKNLTQVHSATLARSETTASCEADGYLLSHPTNSHYAIITADCMPILAVGKNGVSFVHAGWQGVQKKILSNNNIQEISPYLFFVGPHIQSCCYEVSEDFKNNFQKSNSFIKRESRLYFDLFSEIKSNIIEDFPSAEVINSKECTHCNKKYHSYRRDKTTKRNWNIIYF